MYPGPVSVAPLPEAERTIAKAIIQRRINEALAALDLPRVDELEPCLPTSCSRCLLGSYLPIECAWQREIQFSTEQGYGRARLRAVRVAEAWGIDREEIRGAQGSPLLTVPLPPDLVVATAAFDGGQIPELIDVARFAPEDLADPVAPVMLADLDSFYEGQRVRLARPVERYPHFTAPAGALGTVSYSDTERLLVRMDETIEGVAEWDNEIEWYLANGDNPAEQIDVMVPKLWAVDVSDPMPRTICVRAPEQGSARAQAERALGPDAKITAIKRVAERGLGGSGKAS